MLDTLAPLRWDMILRAIGYKQLTSDWAKDLLFSVISSRYLCLFPGTDCYLWLEGSQWAHSPFPATEAELGAESRERFWPQKPTKTSKNLSGGSAADSRLRSCKEMFESDQNLTKTTATQEFKSNIAIPVHIWVVTAFLDERYGAGVLRFSHQWGLSLKNASSLHSLVILHCSTCSVCLPIGRAIECTGFLLVARCNLLITLCWRKKSKQERRIPGAQHIARQGRDRGPWRECRKLSFDFPPGSHIHHTSTQTSTHINEDDDHCNGGNGGWQDPAINAIFLLSTQVCWTGKFPTKVVFLVRNFYLETSSDSRWGIRFLSNLQHFLPSWSLSWT